MNKKSIHRGAVIVALVGLSALVFGCSDAPTTASQNIKVVTSIYPYEFFVSQVAGDKAQVENITPAGAEPHDFEPTAQDIVAIENADLLFLNGGGLEPWGDRMSENAPSEGAKIVILGEGLMTRQVIEDGEAVTDPHVWLSPVLMEQIVDKIEEELSKVDPNNASYFRSNGDALKSQLSELDGEFKQGLTSCGSRDIITSHSAFGYLASTYNLNQVAIAGVSTEEEPSAKDLVLVAKFAKDNNVKYIFFESLVSPKLSQTIATEVGARTLVLNPLEGLSDDEISDGKDYFSVMRDNLANLKIALKCT